MKRDAGSDARYQALLVRPQLLGSAVVGRKLENNLNCVCSFERFDAETALVSQWLDASQNHEATLVQSRAPQLRERSKAKQSYLATWLSFIWLFETAVSDAMPFGAQ